MALGAMSATGSESAVLWALMNGGQNLPEDFTAYGNLLTTKQGTSVSLWVVLGVIMLMGVIAAGIGHAFLATNPVVLGLILLFAAGGIFYLVSQDIAYQAHVEQAWAPALGAVAGFAMGMLGHHIIVNLWSRSAGLPYHRTCRSISAMLNTISLFVLFIITLLPMTWAHYRVSAYSAATRVLVRTSLLGVGAAFGAVMAIVYTEAAGLDQLLVLLSSVGLVHVPAAVILQLKYLRGIPRP